MLRSLLGLSKKRVSAEAASANVLKEVVPSCPCCGRSLNGHQYRLIAATPLKPDHLEGFWELLSAIRSQEWHRVATFQTWEGSQTNAEVYGLQCPEKMLSVVVISAPFTLEEPCTLMHQERVENPATFEPSLPNSDSWHPL